MQPNNDYFPDFFSNTSSVSNNNNNNYNNFHVDNKQQPPQYLNNNSIITSNNVQATHGIDDLRSVEEILPRYRSVFASYPYFNIIQSRVLDVVLYSDDSVVVSAPTGSGKTAIFELAIIRFLMNLENLGQQMPYKIVYVAPMKALCEERLIDWHHKFANFGLTCISVTGDSDNIDFQNLRTHNLIITTPEKWDSLTRRWRDNKTLATLVKLFMIDEVHLISEDHRGPTLEAVVCRMKTIHDLILTNSDDMPFSAKLRFVAVSATIPNVEDVAEWLSTPMVPARSFKFGDDMRPVKLKKVVLGYSYSSQTSTPFKFDIMLSYKLQSIMLQYAEGKPTLIFCSTRKSVEMTSKHLIQNLTINLNPHQKQILQGATSTISDSKIKEMLVNGVCYHHAGLSPEDRKIIEDLFRNANLPILVTTSTLAMGVNLPAHLVIVKSTKSYSNGEYQDYSESMLLQMIGRAGRPQFDSSATAVILTTINDKHKFENMVGGVQSVESNLHKHLTEHLNAEVVLHTITDLGVAMQWLTSTFLHIRARKHPRHYGLPLGLSHDQIDKKLLEMCQIEINRLARAGMLTIDQNIIISPTSTGLLMAKYCIAFDTMKLFTEVTGKEILQQILALISKCREFSEIYLRVNDKKALNLLNKCHNRETIRFPFNGKIKTVDMKINCIIQAVFGCLQILEQSLVTESQKIMRIGERISKCLAEYLETKGNCYSALLSALILAKCFHTRLWENSPFVSKQLSGIGSVFSSGLAAAGKTTFKALLEANPRDIERIVNRKAPMGNTLQDQVAHLPDYELTLEEVIGDERFSVNLKLCLKNSVLLQTHSSVNVNSIMILLVGDTDNNIFLYEKFTHSHLIENKEIVKRFEFPATYEHEIKANFISEDWVGFDCNVNLISTSAKRARDAAKNADSSKNKGAVRKDTKTGSNKEPSHIQQFLDTYFKNSKAKNQKQMQEHLPRTLEKPQKSGITKQNSTNIPNIINKFPTAVKPQKIDSSKENIGNTTKTQSTLQKQTNERRLKRQNSAKVLQEQTEERHHMFRSNSKNLEDITNSQDVIYENVPLSTNPENSLKNPSLQKLIDNSIQEYKKQNEKLQKLQQSSDHESAMGYHLPPHITKNFNTEANSSLISANNYSATVRRNPDSQKTEAITNNNWQQEFSSQYQFPLKTPKNKKYRLKKNMNCSVNYENPLHSDSSLDMDKNTKTADSITLKFKYTPSKKYSHESISSTIKQETESNVSGESEECNSTKMISLKNKMREQEMPEYDIKEFQSTNVKNSTQTSKCTDNSEKSGENIQKTLTWRSPLVISPAARFSPNLENNVELARRERTEGNNSLSLPNCNDNAALSYGNKPSIKFSIRVTNNSSETSSSLSETNVARPTLRQNMLKKECNLPISDQAYSQFLSQRQAPNASICSSVPKNNAQAEDELLSTTLLESLGLIQKHTPLTKENTNNLRLPNTQENFRNAQVIKAAKKGKAITASEYYSQLLSDSDVRRAEQWTKHTETPLVENIKEQKSTSESNVQSQNSQVSQNNSVQQSKKTTNSQTINDISKQDVFDVSDFDVDTSFIPQMFGHKTKKHALDKNTVQPLAMSKSHFSQNPFDFRSEQNSFLSQTLTEENENNLQLGTPKRAGYVLSYKQHPKFEPNFSLPVPHEPPNKFPRAMSGSFQKNPARKRLGQYNTPKFTILPTSQMNSEFGGSQTGDCQCFECHQDFCNTARKKMRPQHEIQNQCICYNHPKVKASQRYACNERSQPQCYGSAFTSCCCPRVPKMEPPEQHDYYDQPQPGTSSTRDFWEITNNAPPCNSFDFSLHENAKRQRFQGQHRIPMPCGSGSFQDHGFPMKHPRYSHHEVIPPTYRPPSEFSHHPHSPFVESGMMYAPVYSLGDKQYLLQRYLNSVDRKHMEQYPKPLMERAPQCFTQPPLDFTICVDEMGDMQYGDDESLSN